MFGPKGEEVAGEHCIMRSFINLYSSPNIVIVIKSRRMRWAGHVVCIGDGRGVYRVLVGRAEVKGPLGRPGRRWEDNIKMDFREIGIELNSAASTSVPVPGFFEHGNVPSGCIKKAGYF